MTMHPGASILESLGRRGWVANEDDARIWIDRGARDVCFLFGRLRAAALDVFVDEPPRLSPLLGLPNVVLTPHIAGLSTGSIAKMLRLASQPILTMLGGGIPDSAPNPDVFAALSTSD